MRANAELDLQKMRHFYEVFPYPNRPLLLEPDPQGSLLAHAGFSAWAATQEVHKARRVWQASRQRVAGSTATIPNDTHSEKVTKSSEAALDLGTKGISKSILDECFRADKRILLVGCGTDEPLLFRILHPQNEIVGIDLSAGTLRRARKKLVLHSIRNFVSTAGASWWNRRWKAGTTLLQGDATEILAQQKMGKYDHVQCFGVLHHQPNPRALLAQLSQSMNLEATLRVMIYSHKGRRLERRIQNRYVGLWDSLMTSRQSFRAVLKLRVQHALLRFWQIYNFVLHSGPASFRFRYLGLSSSTVADALLHPSDPGFPPENLLTWSKELGLKLVFCEARINSEGWISGFADARQVWEKIVEADAKDGLLSNIVAVFKKEK